MSKIKPKHWLVGVLFIALTGCGVATTLNQINLFSLDDEKTFGKQMYAQIQEDKTEYPLVNEATNPALYGHIRRIMNNILKTGKVNFVNDFEWELKIINADVQNAFACPGGKMYVYTGLINYLDNEAQLAGVIGHEIAHVHWRHSTRQMTKEYGIQTLQGLLLSSGTGGEIAQMTAQVAGKLGGLAFSRADESEADATAVMFLSSTEYNPLGVAGFFEKLTAQGAGSGGSPVFLSTHPSPTNRVQEIKAAWVANGSKKGDDFAKRYKDVQKSAKIIAK